MNSDIEQFQREKVSKLKKDIEKSLQRLGLASFVSINEVKKELCNVDTAFQSLLLLGILRRIMYQQNDGVAKLFIPALTEWKNYLPHNDLGGLSPFEYTQKYPIGEYELRFIEEVISSYRELLQSKKEPDDKLFNIEADFTRFQKDYLDQIPLRQPFADTGDKLMTLREIIIRERRRNNHPKDKLSLIGVKIFAENIPEGMGWQAAEIDDIYINTVQELASMKKNPHLQSRKRILKIGKVFEKYEPYHRCGPEPYRFYLNYASLLFLDGEIGEALKLLDWSLRHNPNYKIAQKMKKDIIEWKSKGK